MCDCVYCVSVRVIVCGGAWQHSVICFIVVVEVSCLDS